MKFLAFNYRHTALAAAAGTEADPATQPSVEFKGEAVGTTPAAAVSRKRTVRFAEESANRYYEDCVLYREDRRALFWYTRRETASFRGVNRRNVLELRRRQDYDDTTTTWSQAYAAAYDVCVRARTAADVVTGLAHGAAAHCWAVDDTVGLEKKALQPIAADTLGRRGELVRQVLYLQRYSATTTTHLRQVCRGLSRPSRLYARHVAVVAAAAAATTTEP